MSYDPQRLILLLSRGIAQRRLFSADHPKVVDCHREFVEELDRFFAQADRRPFFIGVEDGKLIYRGRFLLGSNIAGGKLVELAGRLRCGGFTFTAATTGDEVSALITLASGLSTAEENLEQARALLVSHGVSGILLADPYREKDSIDLDHHEIWQGEERRDDIGDVMLTQSLFDVVEQAHGQSLQGRAMDLSAAKTISERLMQASEDGGLDVLQHVHYPDYDTYTVGHSVRVAVLAVMVARTVGFDGDALTELGAAGLLHDVGKSRIPDAILYKPGKLSDEEREIMSTHAVIGAEILMEQHDTTPMMVAAAWGHHLHHGGGGYPASAFPPVRSPVTALLQVCDIFEALTAIRPYKTALTPRRALEIISATLGIFDPVPLKAFIRAIGIYPPGCRVQLSDGSRGMVLSAGRRIDRPRIHVSGGGTGRAPLLDLGEAENADLAVLRILDDAKEAADPAAESLPV